MPLIDEDDDKAVTLATEVVQGFMGRFDAAFLAVMRAKLGLATEAEEDAELIRQLFAHMQAAEADFTLTFRRLADVAEGADIGALTRRNRFRRCSVRRVMSVAGLPTGADGSSACHSVRRSVRHPCGA